VFLSPVAVEASIAVGIVEQVVVEPAVLGALTRAVGAQRETLANSEVLMRKPPQNGALAL
jgi:hypothetical protein